MKLFFVYKKLYQSSFNLCSLAKVFSFSLQSSLFLYSTLMEDFDIISCNVKKRLRCLTLMSFSDSGSLFLLVYYTFFFFPLEMTYLEI